jgi:hypothetical protein
MATATFDYPAGIPPGSPAAAVIRESSVCAESSPLRNWGTPAPPVFTSLAPAQPENGVSGLGEDGEDRDGSIKNLAVIWESKDLNPHGIFGPHNTLLVDDTPSKARRNPENLLWIPSFSLEIDPRGDRHLEDLERYLEHLSRAAAIDGPQFDVRDYVRRTVPPWGRPDTTSLATDFEGLSIS